MAITGIKLIDIANELNVKDNILDIDIKELE